MTDTHTFPDRSAPEDEFLWLEEILADRALDWVGDQNARTTAALDATALETTRERILEVLDSTDRIAMVSRHGEYLYNFWRDAGHPRGLWRRTTLARYRTPEPDWDILLDLDELGRLEGAAWVFAGADLLFPDYARALIRLSPDGGDAVVIREFDLKSKTFVPDGFSVPHAKTRVSWIECDAIFVGTDFGPGSLTASGYPRQARRWRRGEPLADAELVFEIPVEHVGLWAHHHHTAGFERDVLRDGIAFYRSRAYLLQDGNPTLIDVPEDAEVGFHREWLLIELRSDWTIDGQAFVAGSLLATRADDFMSGTRELTTLFTPDAHTSLEGWSWTRNHLLLTTLYDVASRVEVLTPKPGTWSRAALGTTSPFQTISAFGVDEDELDDFWLVVTGFLQPTILQLGTVDQDEVETLKHTPSFFDESAFTVEQHFASSADGTAIPYFQIGLKDLPHNARNPTLLRGYGGFEVSQTPGYDGAIGRAWLEGGGVLVVANIRGGGEYGPAWHQAALRENRHRAYEDFAAVARDLIGLKITSPKHLGCMGGSNGGLLVGNMLTHYPELFGAIVCQVPLLDMKRYTRLSAGTSWIAEYGDPDEPGDWAFIQTFSPYHNLREGIDYPPILFYTATSDDRVGPVQARKMAARMQARGIPEVLFYENREGGHAGSADNAQRAHMLAMGIEFLKAHLFSPDDRI